MVWFGLVWFGLFWFGLIWFGLVDNSIDFTNCQVVSAASLSRVVDQLDSGGRIFFTRTHVFKKVFSLPKLMFLKRFFLPNMMFLKRWEDGERTTTCCTRLERPRFQN